MGSKWTSSRCICVKHRADWCKSAGCTRVTALTYLNGIRQVQEPSDRVTSVFESPEECLSKPQAGIFMAVFNSLSVEFWFQPGLKRRTISGEGSVKPSTSFIPFFLPQHFHSVCPALSKHSYLGRDRDPVFPESLSFFGNITMSSFAGFLEFVCSVALLCSVELWVGKPVSGTGCS